MTKTTPQDFRWHRGIGASLFAYATTGEGVKCKIVHLSWTGSVLVQRLTSDGLPGKLSSYFESEEEAIAALGLEPTA